MGQKKKIYDDNSLEDNKQTLEKEKRVYFNIATEAKKAILAIFLIALAFLIILGFFGKAGIVGQKLSQWTGNLIGWTKIIFPLFLLSAGIILFLRKKTSFYIFKLVGLSIMLLGISAFFHWFYFPEEMLEIARAGSGGGYLGYIISFLAVKYLSKAGALVIILAIFSIGLILALDATFYYLIGKIFRREKEEKSVEDEKEENDKETATSASTTKLSIEKKESEISKNLEDNNIKKIEFVEGLDQYVDQKLFKGDEMPVRKIRKINYNNREIGRDETGWKLPPLDHLEKMSGSAKSGDIERNFEIIENTFKHFGIDVEERGEAKTGPSVTQYTLKPAVGIKVSRILSLQDNLALALAVHPVRIEAPIPNKSLIGVEVPNKSSTLVRLRNLLEDKEFVLERKSNLTLALGQDVNGDFNYGNLDRMPHLLIAGATGTGKSVCINSIIITLLYQNSPQDLKFIMVDPKRVELTPYNGIPHLLSPVVVDNSKVINALRWAVGEMERRYRMLQDTGSRDLGSYNEKIKEGRKKKYKDPETGELIQQELEKLPYIVIIIDELADLMASHGKEVEGAIVRLAQMARAVGIHLIVSTQRPEVKVITGLIKANINSRIAFKVNTQFDSRTIMDMGGAEKLLGNGDMLYLSGNTSKPKRIQGVFVSESEVKRVVKFVIDQKKKTEEELGEDILAQAVTKETIEFKDTPIDDQEESMYEAAKEEVIRSGKASATFLQRRLRIGYARAARIIDMLEERGVVGPGEGAKPREVFIKDEEIAYKDPISDQEKRDKWEM